MTQTCSRCGLQIPEGHAICPACGARVPKSAQYIRCSHCLHRVPSGLTVCPHCGRELKPWRADKWVLAFSLLTLLGLWLFFGNGLQTLGKTRDVLALLAPPPLTPAAKVAVAEPSSTPTPIPAEPTAAISTPAPQIEEATATSTPEPTATSAATATPQPTATSAPTIAKTPANASTPTATATPTEKPSATPTATDTPEPTATATATATSTPSPTPEIQANEYVVKAGDTLSAIAQKVNRTIEALAAYNKIKDPTTIRVGQKLLIPPADYVPPTPTPRRPTKTPTPTPTATPSITLPAPILVNPGDSSAFSGKEALIELIWQPLPPGLPTGAEYVVHIGVQVGPNLVDWRLVEPVGANTSFMTPAWLFGQAPQQYGRAYIWYVQAGIITRNGDQVQIVPISHPSEQRKFYWN